MSPTQLAVEGVAMGPTQAPRAPAVKPVNLLAYVHLRNIYDSTGAGRVARQMVEHLALRDDVNLHILADARDKERVLPRVGGAWDGFPYHTFAEDTSRQQARWLFLGRPPAEEFWPEAEIVFCTGESYVPVRRARLAVTMHDAAYFEAGAHPNTTAVLKQKLKWRYLFRKLAKKGDMFHTVSHFSAERLGHFFPEIRSRLRVVHNAVTPHFFEPVSDSGRTYLAEQGLADRAYVLIPGGLHFRKNAELVLEGTAQLMQQFPDLMFAVVNHSDPAYVERAKALGPRLRMLGFVSDAALHALYAAATMVWFPSRYEGFGLPVIEAMACRAPVVASQAASIPEIAGDAAILADPQSAKAHADALAMLLTDPRAREQFSAAGRARAAGFTWKASAAELKRCFDSLL